MPDSKTIYDVRFEERVGENLTDLLRSWQHGVSAMKAVDYGYTWPEDLLNVRREDFYFGTFGEGLERISVTDFLDFFSKLNPNAKDIRQYTETYLRIMSGCLIFSISETVRVFEEHPKKDKMSNELQQIQSVANFVNSGKYTRSGVEHAITVMKVTTDRVRDLKFTDVKTQELLKYMSSLLFSVRMLLALPNEVLVGN